MSDFKANMHQIRFPPRPRPKPRWERALSALQTLDLRGPSSKGGDGKEMERLEGAGEIGRERNGSRGVMGKEGAGRNGKGREREKGREWNGREEEKGMSGLRRSVPANKHL